MKRRWWIPPVFGRIPAVEDRLLSLLGLVALALFFESYDLSMGTSALKHIAAGLRIGDDALGSTLGTIRLGAIPAFLLLPFADRLGRRRVFLLCIAASSIGTFATAFVQTREEFVAVQMLTRTALVMGSVVAIVIVTEEFPAAHRGWALGMLGALSASGHGLGALLFALIDQLPYGWRFLYGVGIAPLVFWPAFRDGVPETARFQRHADARTAESWMQSWVRPLVALAGSQPRRTLTMALVALLLGVGEVSAFQFSSYYALTALGWHPAQYSTMVIAAGAIGIAGNVVAGRLGDRVGRRIVGAVFFALFPLFVTIFYRGPEWALPLGFAGLVFCNTAGGVIVRALSTELFPTSHRGTSAGWVTVVLTLGWAVGLTVVGHESTGADDIARRAALWSTSVLLAGLALLALPETTRRELEAVSPDAA